MGQILRGLLTAVSEDTAVELQPAADRLIEIDPWPRRETVWQRGRSGHTTF